MKSKLLNFNNREKRTFLIIPGLNHPKIVNVKKITGLRHYEERMLFFLFLLKYPKTNLIYITSKGFNEDLFAYYVGLTSKNEVEAVKRLKRLKHIEIDTLKKGSLASKILSDPKFIKVIKKEIKDPETTFLRCYNPTDEERLIAKRLGISMFGAKTAHAEIGTKSGGKKIFRRAKTNYAHGYEKIKTLPDLYIKMAKLIKKYYSTHSKLVIKFDYSSSGKGNATYDFKSLLKDKKVDPEKAEIPKIANVIENNFDKYTKYQNEKHNFQKYSKRFLLSGGIVELYIPGKILESPSSQILVRDKGKYRVISTHDQILDGEDKQHYVGCEFPANKEYRQMVLKEARKIGKAMADYGVIGNFAVDYVITEINRKKEIYAIEINLRKGGTTHPFRIAQYLTESKYNKKDGLLYDREERPIYYYSMEFNESKNYIGLKPMELIDLVRYSKISFDRKKNEGALVYMPGMVTKYGKFGAISIAHNSADAIEYHKKLKKLVDNYVSNK